MQVVPAVLATLCLVSSVAAAEFEFARIIEEDRYDRPIARPGNPRIIRANTSTGLLVETEMGVYRASSAEPTVIASGEYALPEGAKIRFGHGIRLYGFGGVGGTLTTALDAKGKKLTFSVSGAPSAETLLCRVEGPGMDGLEFPVPVKSLPADFTFYLTDRGDFDWVVSGLADSSETVKKGKSSVFDGFWINGYGYPPLKVETAFSRAGVSGTAEVTVDNRLIGDCTTAEKLDVPVVLSPAPSFDPVREGWPLVFSDEFDGEEVDWSKWYFAPKAGNPDRNDFCRPDGRGVLNLKCDYAAGSTNLTTGSMRSKREFTYGYFESRFKLTRQNGWWAAVWMYGWLDSDPFVDGIEIDIFEDYYTRKKDLQGRNRRQLDHNLHLYLGSQLKSWNFSDDYDGSIDDWIVLGCKRTPFEISYYLNGKLIRSSANHCNWPSVTFDAFNHCAATVPLHIIVSGQVMGPSWPWFDKTDATFPECFQVDYVRCYEMPHEPDRLPTVAWTGESARDDGRIGFFSNGDRFRFDVRATPAAKGGAPIRAVYLFDAGSLIGYRTEPPYAFDVEMTPEWYAKTRYLKPGRQNVVPDFSRAPHSFVAFVQDADGNVTHTGPIRRHPKVFNPATKPFEGRTQAVPGKIVLWRYDEGGQGVAYFDSTKGNAYARSGVRTEGDVDCTGSELANVMPGEWVSYTVDVAEEGLYRVEAGYGTGRPGPHRIHLIVDGASAGSLDCAYTGDGTAWTPDKTSSTEVRLPKGRHVLTLYFHAQLNLAKLSFVKSAKLPVVVQKDRILAEKTAAKELCDYLKRITGAAVVAVSEDAAPEGPAIRLVANPAMDKEEWAIRTAADGSVVISGGRPRGLLYGVYHFLEDVLGVRWLTPVTEVVPRRTTLPAGRLDLRGKPAMPYRSIYLVPGDGGLRFLARNRMNVDSAFYGGRKKTFGGNGDCHTLYSNLGGPDEIRRLYREHPDWFPLIDGKRYCHVERANSAAQSQLCLTNPELREYWTEKLRARIRADRAAAEKAGTDYPMYYAIDQNDCYDGFCKCPDCTAIATREESNAGLLLDFANFVAERLEAEAPEARFQMMALHSTEKPPKTMRARRNVTIRLCDTTSNELVPWTDAQNAKHLDNLKAWQAHADSISMWDYQITYGAASVVCHPTPAERTFAADIRMLRDCRGDGFFFEHESPVTADLRDLKVWLEVKLAENPDLDGDALIREFTDLYYGPEAGAAIRDCRDLLSKAAREAKARVGWFPSLSNYSFLTGRIVFDCYALHTKALAATAGDAERTARVEHAFMSLDRLYLTRASALARQLAKSDAAAKLPPVAEVSDRYRRIFDREAKARGYTADAAGYGKGIKELFEFTEKARDLPVPEQFKGVPSDALFLYPATFATTYYRGMRFVDDSSSPAGRALTANMRLVEKNPYKDFPLSCYDWPLRVGVWATMDGSLKLPLAGCPDEQPVGYRWYKVAEDVRLKADSVVSVFGGSQIPLDGAVSDNSELGQKYDVWASIKIVGPNVYRTGKADWDTVYYLDQVAVVRKTKNGVK